MRVCSADTREAESDFRKDSNSAASGLAFFFGGISPLLARSCTNTHLEKFVWFVRSNLRAVRSNPPFFTSPSWHSKQCDCRNGDTSPPDAAQGNNVTARIPLKAMSRCGCQRCNDTFPLFILLSCVDEQDVHRLQPIPQACCEVDRLSFLQLSRRQHARKLCYACFFGSLTFAR